MPNQLQENLNDEQQSKQPGQTSTMAVQVEGMEPRQLAGIVQRKPLTSQRPFNADIATTPWMMAIENPTLGGIMGIR